MLRRLAALVTALLLAGLFPVQAFAASPVATGDTVTTNEDVAIPITVSAQDATDNDAIASFAVDTGPLHGTLGAFSAPDCVGLTPPVCSSTVTYTPGGNYNGSDSFTFTATDVGAETSTPATVNITIDPVNDAPSFTKGANQTDLEDAGAQTIAGWATAISEGPADESAQTVSFVVDTNSNSALFSVQPAVAANGTLTYTPAANANGVATITLHALDTGGTANGGDDTSATQSFTITVTSVNDAPSFTKGADQSVAEDSGAHSVSGWATAISEGPADESAQTVSFVVDTNSNSALFSVQPAVAANGTLTYTPAANANGVATITLHALDTGGTANGGDDTSATQSFTITVTTANDPPTANNDTLTVLEDAATTTVDVLANDSILPDTGETLTVQSVTQGAKGAVAIHLAGADLTYTPTANLNGADSFTYTASDGNGGTDIGTVDVTITAVNDAPVFTKGANQSDLEDAGAQTVAGWATAISRGGGADEAGQTLTFSVTNDNNPLFSVQPAVSTSTGTLTYTPAANANGVATVSIHLSDNGGTANGGDDTSATQTFTITVTAVNDAPSFTKGANQTDLEDAGAQTIAGWATAISEGPADESAQTVSFVVDTNSNSALFSVQPAVAANGTLTYTPAANANGVATITLHALDTGGTANGGDDTSATQSFTITVTSVNDAPSFTKGADQSVAEDSGAHSVSGWATAISEGPADESAQTVSFVVDTNSNSALFSVQPAVAANGTLTYTPAANANGVATITLHALDTGGTANGGDDTSATQSFTITVTTANDPPTANNDTLTVLEDAATTTVDVLANDSILPDTGETLTVQSVTQGAKGAVAIHLAGADLTYTPTANLNGADSFTYTASDGNGGTDIGTVDVTITAVNDAPVFTKGANQSDLEDAGAQTVAGWATAISRGGGADEAGQTLTFTVTNDNNPLFSVQPAVSTSTGTLTYTPAANANGVATVSIHLSDNGGTANGGDDTSATQTFTITVTAVNDAPSFTKGANQTDLEDAGAQTIAGWATAISEGPADESAQTVSFVVDTNSNSALFSVQPAVAANGTLTYTPAANANGVATITLHALDTGGTANGGDDTSATQSFTITVTSVNDPPVATDDSATVLEDSGVNTIDVLANDSILPDTGETLTVQSVTQGTKGTVTIPVGGASVRYTPAANANGADVFTYSISDGNGGVDTAIVLVTITSVNDAPVFTKGANQSDLEDAGAQTVAGWATGIGPGGGADEAGQTLTFGVTGNTNAALFSVLPAISSGGTLTYTPAANANGVATITIELSDNGGTANGGDNTSAPQTFTITVTAVNDAPSFTKGADQSDLEDAGAQTVAGWASAISHGGGADETSQTLTFTVTNDNNPLFSVQPAVSSGGTLTYTPAANANGSATVSIQLFDNGGTANGGDNSSALVTFDVTITAVNDAPVFTKGANQSDLEDAGAQTVAGWATAISRGGGADEAGQTLTFTVTNDNNPLFSVQPAVSTSTGTLTYTPAANANGVATVSIHLSDNGGTANGGDDTSATQTFTITVTAVNDAPSFTKGANQTDLEDAGAQTIAGWATAISEGPADESAQTVSFVVDTNSNSALFSVQPAVAANGTLTYTPAANANGVATITLHALDTGGTANGGDDTSATQSFTITVTSVNDAPTFVQGADPTVDEDAGAQTRTTWATSIFEGAANEVAQTISFSVTDNSNPTLFSAAPAVATNGTLTFTAATNGNGTASIDVVAIDNGGTANGGDDTSIVHTFTITVNAVNDVPSFTAGADETVLEDAGPQTVSGWATALSTGPLNESAQVLTFETTSNSNPGLFAVAPAVASDGTLTYTPAADANGTADVAIRVADDGGTANGGVDTSATQTLTITVTAVNDAPSFGAVTVGASEDSGLQTVPLASWATSVSPGPGETGQVLTFSIIGNASDQTLFSVQPAMSAAGTLTFTPAAHRNGSATIDVQLSDDGGTANGGSDTSPTVQVTIDVSGVNDPPIAANDIATVRLTAPTAINVRANDSGGPNEPGDSYLITSVQEGTRGIVTITGGGTGLTYDPIWCTTGSDTFSYTLTDAAGLTDTATVLVTISAPAAYPIVDAPKAGFVTNSTIGSTVPVSMSWCGLTSGTTIKSYALQQSTNGGAFGTIITATTAKSSTRNLSVSGTRYAFRARVTDNRSRTTGYATSPTFRVQRWQENSAAIVYSTAWASTSSSKYSGGAQKWTVTAGKTATFTYTGRAFAIVGPKSSTRGSFNVYVDGVKVTTTAVSEKATTTVYQRVLYWRFTSLGTHTVQIVAVGNGRIDLDAIVTIATP